MADRTDTERAEDYRRMDYTIRAALNLAETQIARVMGLHEPDTQPTPFCSECGHVYPCRTIRIFRGEENDA